MGVNLGGVLPDLLRRRGWTQQRLADETGLKRTDINRIANGRLEVGADRLSRIAAALEVPVTELGADDPTAPTLSLSARLEALGEAVATLLRNQEEAMAALQEIRDELRREPATQPAPPKHRIRM